ncbi:DNA polymerase/3'-5' exonuclease PolX [Sporolactobacillus shoreae]|uniref:DNA-directed DNA polymerase n=1 Tax=Sporolactobacillus shoreae TaxID=1465501 RepID=A0A4Z0GRC5_9BACL|nr:DNA polymerase/3'-5' exonuclease PolX [Sporolactobacillus shoreae]TGA99400.1 DNA polymerase/3'-5' exonuclease PolX [Sporolactobacillus shoreae]
MNKKQIIDQLDRIALYLEIRGDNPFKIAAYRRAGQALETDQRSVAGIDDFSKIKGIGRATADVIKDLMMTGESSVLRELQKEIPSGLLELVKIQGLGGKKIGKLYQALNVTDLASLREACEGEQVRGLPGFGEKTEEKLLETIKKLNQRPEQLPIPYMLGLAEKIESALQSEQTIKRFSRAGSLRRAKESMKDLDFVIETDDPENTADRIIELLPVSEVTGRGDAKMTVVLDDPYHVSVDFRFAAPEAYVTTLHHFTGSKEHNILLRHLAKEHGEKISEYGVEAENKPVRTFSTEEELYGHFGLSKIPPEVREGTDEVEKAKSGLLGLIRLSDIKGDLHMHSTWSDGSYTVQEMAEAMRARGYAYACLTDHSKSLRVASGLSEERLLMQLKEVARVNALYEDFTLFSGVEMDILPDGSLDYSDDILKKLDFVIASIHFSFSQSTDQIMKRLESACRNPYVRLIAHPTGRLLGKRSGYPVNLDRLIQLAKETGTALELNSNRNRLDLSSERVRKAQEAGVRIAIDTDSHSKKMMEDMSIGVQTAVRGWIRAENVLNTMTVEQFTTFLRAGKKPF